MKKQNHVDEFPDFDEFFEENGAEMLVTMAEVLKGQQQIAVELTRLVLEYSKPEKVTKDTVFNIFKDATKVVSDQLDQGI